MDAAVSPAQTAVGVTHAFERLYRTHWRDVYRLSLRYSGGDQGWAEDLAHDVFIKLLEHLPELTDADNIGAWLYRVTANAAISRLRREQSWMGRFSRVWRAMQHGPASPEVIAVRNERAVAALATMRRLPPKERVALSMKVLDGKSQKEIAKVLELSEGYVSKLIKSATEKVRAEEWDIDND